MSWSPAMRESRRSRGGQMDWIDNPVLSYKLVCDGNDPLTNAFVVVRKEHDCDICAGTIRPGQRVRRETRRSADGLHIDTRYVCTECSLAIKRWAEGYDQLINGRHDLGKRRRS